MGKGILLLCVCLFMILLVEPVLAEEGGESLKKSWGIEVEAQRGAIYNLPINEKIHGAIIHLVTLANISYPNTDSIIIFFIDKDDKAVRTLEISHDKLPDINAVQDLIIFINPENKGYQQGVYIKEIKVNLNSGAGSEPRLVKDKSYVKVITQEQSQYGDFQYAATTKKDKSFVQDEQTMPGFSAYSSASTDICHGFEHERSFVDKFHSIKFIAPKTGQAEISFTFFYGGVGNNVETPGNFFGASKAGWQVSMDVELLKFKEVEEGKPEKGAVAQTLRYAKIAQYSNYPSVEEYISGVIEDRAKDKAKDDCEKAAEKGLKDISKVLKAKGKYKAARFVRKACKLVGPVSTAMDVASTIHEFYESLQVDEIMSDAGTITFPNVYLDANAAYELKFRFKGINDATCVGALQSSWSYIDFWKGVKIKITDKEKEFKERGFAIYDVLILYKPKPLGKYQLPVARITEPTTTNVSAEDIVCLRGETKGGKKPFSYKWIDYFEWDYSELGTSKQICKKMEPGEHLILFKVTDDHSFSAQDSLKLLVIPPKPKLEVEEKSNGINLSWNEYKGKSFAGYDVLVQFDEEEGFMYYKSTKNNSLLYPFFDYLADKEICFKVRLKTKTGVAVESNKACAKMPILLSLTKAGVNSISLSWTSVKTETGDLNFEFRKENGSWGMPPNVEVEKGYIKVSGLEQNTTYYFRVKDENEIYSNIVKARTLENKPPIINITNTSKAIIQPLNEKFKEVPVVFRPSGISVAEGSLKNAIVQKGKLVEMKISDEYGIKSIECDFENEGKFIDCSKAVVHIYKPGTHVARIRATDLYDATTEKTITISVKTKPLPPKVDIKAEKLFDLGYGEINISVNTKDFDGQIEKVVFFAVAKKGKHVSKPLLIGEDKIRANGWKVIFDSSKIFDELKDFCNYVKLDSKEKCYLNIELFAEVIDSDGFKVKSSLEQRKEISILEPLPDLISGQEIEWIEPIDSELLKDLGLAEKRIAEAGEINKTYEPKPTEKDILMIKDREGNYRIIGTIVNTGQGSFTGEIPFTFYMKREISCPLWYLKSIGCFKGKPIVKVKVNATQTKSGFICPRENVGSYGGNLPSCVPPPTCFCTKEIYSGSAEIKDFEPGDITQVSATVTKQELEKFAEETEIGKKVKLFFAIDGDNEILEEDESNNVVSRDIWIESRIKPQLIKGGNPKSFWYGFGRFFEQLDLMFTFDNKAKFEKELRQASKRLEEVERMLKAGEFETAGNLLEDYSKNMESASELVDKLSAEEKLEQSKVLMIVTSFYINALEDIYTEEISNEFENAVDSSLRVQQKAIKEVSDTEPMAASMMLQFESAGLRPDLMVLNADIPEKILVGETVAINFSVLNGGKTDSDFEIILYEEGNPVKSISERICAGCMSNYSLTWVAKKGVNEISVGLEEPKDANPENNYVTLSVEVISPKCYSDQECSDANPCTKDICIAEGTAEARCEHIEITQCIHDDGCCPIGCNALNDNDCKALCGNQACEPGEQDKCCMDCGCPEGYECRNNECVLVTYCGNGVCEPDENKCNCPEDCGYCEGSCKDEPCWEWECVDDRCECELQANCCGNHVCEENEYYLNCQTGEFVSSCPDCCDPFISHQVDEPCQCPPNTEKIIINPETGEFVCECVS